jgi:DNA-binding cell septation regulator SpoVG
MEVQICNISGPTEPSVYAIASVQLSDRNHNIVIRDIEVLEDNGRVGVYFPSPRQEEPYGDGPLFELSRELKQAIADLVLDAFENGVPQFVRAVESNRPGFALVFHSPKHKQQNPTGAEE